jgi:ElaB/YqjD/DUF883 family membrane-anchored ribosome-binding protein
MANTATETAHDAASTAHDKAVELKEQGKNKLGQTLDQRTTEAGTQARHMAQALRDSSERLRTDGSGKQVAGITESAADRIEKLRDVEQFARRRPWMIAGLGMVAGLAASRFLKASSERRYEGNERTQSRPLGSDPMNTVGGSYADEPQAREYATTG